MNLLMLSGFGLLISSIQKETYQTVTATYQKIVANVLAVETLVLGGYVIVAVRNIKD